MSTDTVKAVAGRTGEGLSARDRRHLIHPYLVGDELRRVVMVEGDGCRLRDADGIEYLDATGGLWLAQVGHGRRRLAEVASAQMQRLEYFTSFWEFSNDRAIELAERLSAIAPGALDHVFFTSGGSEGNEAAIKMARYYHHQRGAKGRTVVLARRSAYHGVGYGSGTATGFDLYHAGFGPMLPDVEHLTPPWSYRAELFDGRDATDYCVDELERTIHRIGADRIAAMIGEPIMGVAGMVVPPDDYWPRVAEVLRAHGILLIFDEVVTAYGRIGEWFAAQRYGVQPDLVTTAKGITSGYIPLGAVLVSSEIADVIVRDGFPMGYTYNGHPTACAVALENLAIIEEEGLLEAARVRGNQLRAKLDPLERLPIVGEVRGVGLMLAIELVEDKATRHPLPSVDALQDRLMADHRVIVRNCQHSLVLSPPLVLSESEAELIVDALDAVLADACR